MHEILFQYHKVNPTTWAYLSSLLMIGLFFKFGRFWSVRNLDLVLLALLAPGLLLIHAGHELQLAAVETPAADAEDSVPDEVRGEEVRAEADPSDAEALIDDTGPEAVPDEDGPAADVPAPVDTAEPATELADDSASVASAAEKQAASENHGRAVKRAGYIWLFGVGAILLARLLADPNMVRRPLLEPNLSQGGMIFIGISMFVFLMANVVTSKPIAEDLRGPRAAEMLLTRDAPSEMTDLRRYGPGYPLMHVMPTLPTISFVVRDTNRGEEETRTYSYTIVAKTMAILAHLAIVLGIVGVGYRHFDNFKMGVGVALVYLMLPYTWLMTGRVEHCLPAALLVWTVMTYRRPVIAGILLGLAISTVYFPLFLLPLWISFYWQRGVLRFLVGIGSSLLIAMLSLALVSPSLAVFGEYLQGMLGLWRPIVDPKLLEGVWSLGWSPWYRIPLLAACVVMSLALAFIPAQKNLGTLLSCSAAVMVAVQFWNGHGGGLFIAWYLPLLLLTIFRPNLEDRVALNVLGEGWFPRRRNGQPPMVRQAA